MDETTKQPQHRPRVGATGVGTGPVVAAGVMFAGGVVAAGIGLGSLAFGEGEAQEPAGRDVSAQSPATAGKGDEGEKNPGSDSGGASDEGTVTVTLPDEDGNGVADELEERDAPPAGSGSQEKGSDPGTVPEEPKPETRVYIIECGDTLTEISADTGVPIGTLVQTNNIANPNLIYAGSALLIPPTL